MDPWTAWTECSPSVARMLFHSVATWTSTRMPCTGLIVLNLLRITPVCMMGVCRFIQPPPKNGGFLLRHHLHPAGPSKPSVSALHSAGVTVAFEMGAGTQTLTLTLAQLVLSPVEPPQPSDFCAAVGGALSRRQSDGCVVGGTGLQGVAEMARDCLLDCRNRGRSPQSASSVQSECSTDKRCS